MNYNIIIGLILIGLIVLKVNNKLNISFTELNIIIGITILLMLRRQNKLEFMTNNDMLQNIKTIKTIFDTDDIIVENLDVSGDLDIDGKLTVPDATITNIQSGTKVNTGTTLNITGSKLKINGTVDIPEATINKLKTDKINLGLTSTGGTIDCGYNKLKVLGNDVTMDTVKMNSLNSDNIRVGLTDTGGKITGAANKLVIDSNIKVTGLMNINTNRLNAIEDDYFRVNEGNGGYSYMYYSKAFDEYRNLIGTKFGSISKSINPFPW